MKRFSLYRLPIITVVILLLVSCNKFLDQNPISIAADATSWKTDADANAGVAACYSLTRAALNTSVAYYAYGDLPSDIFDAAPEAGLGRFDDVRHVRWATAASVVDPSNPMLRLRIYSDFYTAVQQSNRTLYFLSGMQPSSFTGDTKESQDAQRNKYVGEALFMRAFNYFYMARVWGDVPLDTSYQADISTFTGAVRTPQKAVLAAALADLSIAKQYLTWKDNSSADRAVRADKGAAFALMAHIYAWEGSYDSCRMACDSVINGGGYSLVAGALYPSIYLGQSPESIFEIAQNTQSESSSVNGVSSIAFFTLAAPIYPPNPVPAWRLDTSLLKQLYSDTNDVRYKSEFVQVNSGSQVFYSCIKYSNLQTITASNAVNYYLSKNNIVIFRLSDILLLKAEALAAQPSPDYEGSLNLVNQVRARANAASVSMPSGRTSMIDLITAERGRELYLEGHRFYDLVRNERLTGNARFGDITTEDFIAGKYYWPIDPSIFTTNALITQTPFWAQLLTH